MRLLNFKIKSNLKSKQYYIDLYDGFTINRCRNLEKDYHNKIKNRVGKKMTEKDKGTFAAYKLMCYYICGEDYLEKENTISEWIERDKAKDELLENAQPPINIFCKECNSTMNYDLKVLHHRNGDEEEKVLFFFDCPNKCKKKRAFFENGEEYIPKPHLCEKCYKEVKEKSTRTGEKIKTVYTCISCGHKQVNILDLSDKPEEVDKDFEKDRKRFCLTEEQGGNILRGKIA